MGKYLLRNWLDPCPPSRATHSHASAASPCPSPNGSRNVHPLSRPSSRATRASRQICHPDKVDALFRAFGATAGKHDGAACWQLLFYALWHRIHVEGRDGRGRHHDRAGGAMTDSFDLLIRGGMLRHPGGSVAADIGVQRGRIAAIGALSGASAAEVFDARGPPRAARRDRHPGPFPRAGASSTRKTWRPARRGAALGGVTAVFEMPNTNPPTTTRDAHRRQARPRAKGRMHCDHAFYVGATHENSARCSRARAAARLLPASRCSWAPRPARCWSTTTRAIERGASGLSRRAAVPCRGRSAPERARASSRAPGDSTHASGVARRGNRACVDRARLLRLARAAGRRVHVLHVTHRRGDRAPRRRARTSRPSKPTPQHLTLVAPEVLRAARRLRADEPADPRRAPPRRALARRSRRAWSTCSAPTTRRTRARRRRGLYPDSPSGMPGVQTLVP